MLYVRDNIVCRLCGGFFFLKNLLLKLEKSRKTFQNTNITLFD